MRISSAPGMPLAPQFGRPHRKAMAEVAGVVNGTLSAISSIPLGIAEGLTQARAPETHMAARRKRSSLLGAAVHTLGGAAAGAFVGGPVGLVVGGAIGYISANLYNHLGSRSEATEREIERIDAHVDKALQGRPEGIQRTLRAVAAGVTESVREGWKSGRMTGSVAMAGAMDAVNDLREEAKASAQTDTSGNSAAANAEQPGVIGRITQTALGVVCGISGVLINVPGGIVEGALQAMTPPGEPRPAIARPLLLFATNVGKVLPPAIVGAAIGGPVGAALGTVVGLAAGSLTSIIDGRDGLHKGISRRIEQALKRVEDNPDRQGMGLYYRTGQGVVVGAVTGLREGWRRGFDSGRDIGRNVFLTPSEAAETEETGHQP